MNLLTIGGNVIPPDGLLETAESIAEATKRKVVFVFAADFEQARVMIDKGMSVSSVLFNTGTPCEELIGKARTLFQSFATLRRIKVGALFGAESDPHMLVLDESGTTLVRHRGRSLADFILGLDPRGGGDLIPQPIPRQSERPCARQRESAVEGDTMVALATETTRRKIGTLSGLESDALAEEQGVAALGSDLDLTPRQNEVLRHVCEGRSNRDIARALGTTEGTVKAHCKSIFRALGVANRTQAALAMHQAEARARASG